MRRVPRSRIGSPVGQRALLLAAVLAGGLMVCGAAAQTPAAAAPAAAEAQPTTMPGAGQSPEDQAEAIRKLIMQRLAEAQAAATTQPAKPQTPVRLQPALPPKQVPTRAQLTSQPAFIGAPASQPKTPAAKGCGGAATDIALDPPPADQPQPRYSCEQDLIELVDIWSGQPAEFTFNIKNVGEGVLNIRLRGK